MNSHVRKSLFLLLLILLFPSVTIALSVIDGEVELQHAGPERVESITGYFSILWGDPKPGSGLEPVELYFLTTDEGVSVGLDLANSPDGNNLYVLNRQQVVASGVLDGTTVPSEGIVTLRNVTLQPSQPVQGAAQLSPQRIEGPKPWVSLLCKFHGHPEEPRDKSYFVEMYDSYYPGLDHCWNEVSYGYLDLEGSTAVGWFEMPEFSGSYSPGDLGRVCMDVADDFVYFPDFDGVNFMFNIEFDESSWGGSIDHTIDGVQRFWRATLQNPWGYETLSVMAHEMGHGFGLPHSYFECLNCYDNQWDVMSDTWSNCEPTKHPTYGCLGQHVIAHYKSGWWETDWIDAEREYIARPGRQTITLERLAQPGDSGYLLARVPLSNSGSLPHYTVEARTRVGYDTKLPGEAIILHKVGPENKTARVVDSDGNGNTGDEGAMWQPGEIFSDPEIPGMSITVDKATSTGFQVSIILPDLNEPNNARAEATWTSFGETEQGLISPAGDTDFFKFKGSGDDEITVAVTAASLGSALDSTLALFNETGEKLADNNDYAGTTDSYLTFTLPVDGMYYLRVRGARHPNIGGLDYHYELRLRKIYYDENEPNDTFDEAIPLPDDQQLIGLINPAGDVDFFTFQGQAVDNIWLHIGTVDGASNFSGVLEVYDADRRLLYQENVPNSLNFTLEFDGQYYARVIRRDHPGNGGMTHYYSIFMQRSVGDVYEPNDSASTAAPVAYGQMRTAYIAPPGDVDYFVLSGHAGHEIVIETRSDDSPTDPVLYLFDENLALLADNDNYGDSKDSHIDFVLPADGSYYIKLREASHGTAGGSEYRYALLVTLIDQHEPNDTWQQATQITYGETIWGAIDYVCVDSDYFVFSGQAGDEIVADIDAAALGSPLRVELNLYASDGITRLTPNYTWEGDDPTLFHTLPTAGSYYLEIVDVCEIGSQGGPYLLMLERVWPGPMYLPMIARP